MYTTILWHTHVGVTPLPRLPFEPELPTYLKLQPSSEPSPQDLKTIRKREGIKAGVIISPGKERRAFRPRPYLGGWKEIPITIIMEGVEYSGGAGAQAI